MAVAESVVRPWPTASPSSDTACGSRPDGAQTGGQRDRLLSDLLAQATEATPGSTEDLDVAEALIRWFGPALLRRYRGREQIRCALDRDIAEIDALLSAQVNAILHAPAFQRLEAGWRGLLNLARIADGVADAKIKVLCVKWVELVRDLERAGDFDRSQLFQKVYSEEFGMPGGEPFGLIVANYDVQHRPTAGHPTDDVSALKALSEVAAAAFVPILLGVSPSVLQLDDFRALGRPLDLRTVFRQPEYQRWNAMRLAEDMRFIGLALPRMLMRLPYGDEAVHGQGFCFREDVRSANADGYLWGNPSFAFAGVVLRAFQNFGWFADIRGTPRDDMRGGLAVDLPVPSFKTDKPGIAIKLSTECMIFDAQERDLTDLGFIVLRKVPLTELSAFSENQSMYAAPRFEGSAANASAQLTGMLQYTLCVSRFAHFIKVIGREHVGSVMTAEECQDLLQRWLTGYCVGSDTASAELKARHPLREGRVEVTDVPGRAGVYACSIFLRPHFQLDDLSAGFRLVTRLAPAMAG
jgi:type VI secretion system protein ImpD